MIHHQKTIVAACVSAMLCATSMAVSAQTLERARPRRHFVTISYDWLNTQPLHFKDHPLGDLLGKGVTEAYFEDYDYKTEDGSTLVDVLEFQRHLRGAGVTLFPFGVSVGTALALRGSIEQMPTIRMAFSGPAPVSSYAFTHGKAFDGAVGLYVSDRAPGWGLGSHAFVAGGVGRIESDLGGGSRYFAEGGGGVSSGPLGVELSVKFAWNRLSSPVDHRFLTVPIAVRGTFSF